MPPFPVSALVLALDASATTIQPLRRRATGGGASSQAPDRRFGQKASRQHRHLPQVE